LESKRKSLESYIGRKLDLVAAFDASSPRNDESEAVTFHFSDGGEESSSLNGSGNIEIHEKSSNSGPFSDDGGLKSDSARYLRMNKQDRWELQVPAMGALGELGLSQIFFVLQEYYHKEAAKNKVLNARSGLSTQAMQLQKAMHIDSMAELSARLDLSVLDVMLFEHLDQPDEEALVSSIRLSEKGRKILGKKACLQMAREIVKDFGHPPGDEINRSTGLGLVNVVLMRARDNARGLCSLASDTLSANMEIDGIARRCINNVPGWAVPNSGRPRKRLTLGRLFQISLRKASRAVWRALSYSMRKSLYYLDDMTEPTTGANALVRMLESDPRYMLEQVEKVKNVQAANTHQSAQKAVMIRDLYKEMGVKTEHLDEEFVEFNSWPERVSRLHDSSILLEEEIGSSSGPRGFQQALNHSETSRLRPQTPVELETHKLIN